MKTIKRISLFALSALFLVNVHTLNAQVTIGSELEPVSGALLDLKESSDGSADKGFKLPKVNLASLNSLEPCVANATDTDKANHKGLQVYNTNTSVGEGVLTWDGTRWSSFAMETQIVTGNLLISGIVESASGYTNLKYAELTIEQAGVYLIEAACYATSKAVSYAQMDMYNADLSKRYWQESDYIGRGTDDASWRRLTRSSAVRLVPGKYYVVLRGTALNTHISISPFHGSFTATLLNY